MQLLKIISEESELKYWENVFSNRASNKANESILRRYYNLVDTDRYLPPLASAL